MNKKTTSEPQELFRNRSSSQEFLLCKTEPKFIEDKTTARPLGVSEGLAKVFPHLLVGNTFITTAMSKLNASSYFALMVIRIDDSGIEPDHPDNHYKTNMMHTIAGTIEEIAKKENAIWGPLNRVEVGCFFPEKNSLFCLNTAKKICNALDARSKETVSIGIAAFPTINYDKSQILENAYKALAHAAFFGPGSVVSFDSVSLNVSADNIYQRGDIRGAIREYKQALLLDPENVNVYNSIGVCYGVLGQLDEALEEFKIAISLNPAEAMAIYNAGLVYTIMGDNEKGLQYFLEAYLIDENIFEVAFHIGKSYFDMGKPQKGIEFFEKALKLRPESGAVFRYLGECYAAIHMIDEAISVYTKAIKLNPNDAVSLSALGHLYALQNKDLEIATMFCWQSVQLSPQDGLFRDRLGRLYLKQNRHEEARMEFKTAKQLGYNSDDFIDQIQNQQTVKKLTLNEKK